MAAAHCAAVAVQLDGRTEWPVASTCPGEASFDPRRYWRGPTWVNVNWMLIDGLERSGAAGLADKLRAKTIELVERSGMFEYFHPRTGEGLGADRFSWTAALLIDLLARA